MEVGPAAARVSYLFQREQRKQEKASPEVGGQGEHRGVRVTADRLGDILETFPRSI